MKIQVLGLVLATLIAAPQIARAQRSQSIVPPPMPGDLELSPDEFTPFLVGHAIGTQGYVCVAVGAAYNWVPFGPQATLFDVAGRQVMTHFLSPAPFDQVLSPTWQHSRDTSAVWGRVLKMSSDSNYVAPGAIPLTVTSGASARASPIVRFTRAALEAQYARYCGHGRSASRSHMFTTCPPAERSIASNF